MSVNTVHKELHLDNFPYEQPDGSYRDSRNGIITHIDGNTYAWKNLTGTLLSFTFEDEKDEILTWVWLKDRFFVIILNQYLNIVKIFELEFGSDNIGTATLKYSGSNTLLNLSFDNPIRKIIGFYEDEEIQRIYFVDNDNQPRVINMGSSSNTGLITASEKFFDFYPAIDESYGKFTLLSTQVEGNLYAGTYFFCWQYFTDDGYYSDWSSLTSPVIVAGEMPQLTRPDDYQNFQGKNYTENTQKGIQFNIQNLDTDYDGVRIAAFYSNDYNSVEKGIVFYSGTALSSINTIYTGSETIESIITSELLNTSVVIEKCSDLAIIKNRMVLVNMEERKELDVRYSNNDGRNDRMDCNVKKIEYGIVLDNTMIPTDSWSVNYKAIQASRIGNNEQNRFFPGIWYKNTSITDIVYETSDSVIHTIPSGHFFRPSELIEGFNPFTGPIYSTSYAQPYIVILKYRKSSAVIPANEITNQGVHINDGWVFDSYPLFGHWLDYKSPLISHHLKGYPQGERIRLGVVFYDHTGRPFFARWLKNNEFAYSIDGDVNIPFRDQSTNRLVTEYTLLTDQCLTIGHITGLRITNLDITDIKDRVKAMMIVRAPIVRKYPASGIVHAINFYGVDAYNLKSFTGSSSTNYDPNAYVFYCPEEIFDFSGVKIEPGDWIKNNMYLKAKHADQIYKANWQEFGYIEHGGASPGFVQKFVVDNTLTPASNGFINVSHEIQYYTKYVSGTEDESVYDPRNIAKLYKNYLEHTDGVIFRSELNNHAVLVLDIIHSPVSNIKGVHTIGVDNAHVLVGLLEKKVDNTYGGISEAGLTGTQYISTGHYQEINSQVLTDIRNGDQYIFNDIDVFGGDTYVCMFSHCRGLTDDNKWSDRFNHSFIVPLETQINLTMRGDNHIARNRSYGAADNPEGLIRSDTTNVWEDYNYNDAYSTDNIDAYYIAYPFNFREQNIFQARMRYSDYKYYGELRDSFRVYQALNYIDVGIEFGPVINVASTNNYLIYWQPDMIGYIPIEERAIQAGELGQPIQIGVGGIFERYDMMVKHIGNSNQFGLVESPMGFHWYDAKRKLFLYLPLNMQLSQESIVRGADSFFSNIPYDVVLYDNPIKDYGIFGGYDPLNKVIYYSFILPDQYRETMIINTKTGALSGFADFNSRMYTWHKTSLLSVNDDRIKIYNHNLGSDNKLYGLLKDAYLTIVVKAEDLQEKIFDSFVCIGNNQFFDVINYKNSSQEILEAISGNRNYLYRNNRWYGNFPKVNRQRFVDGYLIVTLKITDDTKTVMFNKMISQLTNMY